MDTKRHYTIGYTSEKSRASRKQIRSWENLGLIPKAKRVVCGSVSYRYFNDTHIAIISEIKSLMDEDGLTLKAAAKRTKEKFKKYV